ncbi:glycosyltransferase family 1 protein [Salipaludibacillus daqingensis]|uniref:glycosyltransferase family 1 protein n=1 Tax=Salipaludibacillus daqingensis TaxID=3041001 RepID=UPI0024766BCF|nr:glycosyltransferase family 1 protein [Salipaludibacillus daqingensis]
MGELTRVLHVFGRLDSGGAESRTMDIYRCIDKTKVQFDFAIHTEDECFFSEEIRSLGGKIFHFPRFTGKNYFEYKNSWLNFFKSHQQYKIIHGHQTSTGFIYLNEAKKNGIPKRIAHARNSNKDSSIKKYTTRLTRFYATDLLAVSKLAGISEFGKKFVNKGTVKIIPNAIQVNKYSFNNQMRIEKRLELGLINELAVVHIGRFESQKNHDFLLRVFKEAVRKSRNLKLFLIGNGPAIEMVKAKIQQLGIENKVQLLGIRSDVPEILQAMDILLFPSLFEGLPGVVLEAQASGIPCVISENITDEVKITNLVKYVSLSKSPDYWADILLRYSQKFKRINTYSDIVEAGYDIQSVSNYYEELYLSQQIYENYYGHSY